MPRNRQILNIALPSIVSNITVPLLGLVDVAIVGHLGSAVYIGAIAVGSMIFNLIYWLFGFLRMGTSGMTSQALGRRDLTVVVRMLRMSVAISMAIAASFLLLQWPLREVALLLMHPTADIWPLAATYFNIVIWGAPAVMTVYSLNGWFIGMQNSRIPMIVSIGQNVVNIVVSLVLVFGFGMKLEGVALGTVVAQYAGLLLALALLMRHYGRLKKYQQAASRQAKTPTFHDFFKVNRDIFLRTLCLVAVNLFFTSAGARQGAIVLSVNTLLMQLYILFSYVMDGFAYAGEALGGKYYGAGNKAAFHDVVRRIFLWGAGITVGFTAAYAIGGTAFLRLLTNEAQVISASGEYFFWALLIPVAGVAAFVWDGIFIGITATRGMLISSVVASAAFFLTYWLLKPSLGNHALWAAFIVYLLLRGGVQTVLFHVAARL